MDTPEEAVKRFAAAPAEATLSVDEAPGTETLVEAIDKALARGEVEGTGLDTVHLEAQIEDKFDGMRVQLHCADSSHAGWVVLYSRNREDVSASYPELCEAFSRASSSAAGGNALKGLILDGEVLAWDVAQQRALPFAVLSPRIGRKKVTNAVRSGTPGGVYGVRHSVPGWRACGGSATARAPRHA